MMAHSASIAHALRLVIAATCLLVVAGAPRIPLAQELCQLFVNQFEQVEEICVTNGDCELGVFGPEAILCDALCMFPQQDGSLGCIPDPFASGVVCDFDQVLIDGVCTRCPQPNGIENGQCVDPFEQPDDVFECGAGAVLRGATCVPCDPDQVVEFGECISRSDPPVPDLRPLIAAGLAQDFAFFLFEEAPDVLTRIIHVF